MLGEVVRTLRRGGRIVVVEGEAGIRKTRLVEAALDRARDDGATGDQMVDDGEPFPVRPGQAIWIPRGQFHSTVNTGWEPMVLLAAYAPAGAEQVLKTLPDYVEVPAGSPPPLVRAS